MLCLIEVFRSTLSQVIDLLCDVLSNGPHDYISSYANISKAELRKLNLLHSKTNDNEIQMIIASSSQKYSKIYENAFSRIYKPE